MKGFRRNGSMAEEEGGGVAAVELDYSTGISSEVSSSCRPAKDAGNCRLPAMDDEREGLGDGEEEGEDELELGLSLGAKKVSGNGGGAVRSAAGGGAPWGEYCRILTAKDFPSIVASRGLPISPSSSTASSSPSLGGGGGGGGGAGRAAVGVAGTKRAADSVAPEVGSRAPSQVVGWPPIRAYRMNSLMNQSRDNSDENNKNNGGSAHHDKAIGHSSSILRNAAKENVARREHEKKGFLGGSLFVKVNMDGMPIGRKVDLNAHHTYETLALALEDMFQNTSSTSSTIRTARTSSLLDGSSEFVLTYEDKDGDWMLVGDVPWGMFLSTVKRLRIMRTSDATGLGPRCQTSKVGGLRKNHM
ncbi:hypothetical protein Taro_003617 [Colocasia esculenta]|uniref:Auxin-responsive protein n=1 Tax=Colocasia esculenta TaxID=4460 RepID=A0A843TG05_COLES|nr:hypothetical protein [Colocasia esculenta]